MSETPRPRISRVDVFNTAKVVESLGDNLSFSQAYALSRLVLQFDGGPTPRTGKRAPIDARTIGALKRRGYVELGGEERGRRYQVSSVRNSGPSQIGWSVTAQATDSGRIHTTISASDEAVGLVSRAWDQITDDTGQSVASPPDALGVDAPARNAANLQGSVEFSDTQSSGFSNSHQERPSGSTTKSVAPKWTSDLAIRRGGPDAIEVVVFGAGDSDSIEALQLLAKSWAEADSDQQRPWIAIATTPNAFRGVSEYFRYAPGENTEHDKYMAQVEALIPLNRCALTSVWLNTEAPTLIEIEVDPPNVGSELTRLCKSRFQELGIRCHLRDIAFEALYAAVEYATGEHGYEQVVDWDDLYSTEQLSFWCHADRLSVTVGSAITTMDAESTRAFARVIPSARREIHDAGGSFDDAKLGQRELESALLPPTNWDNFLDGAEAVTETLPALDGWLAIPPKATHIVDAFVRQWADLNSEALAHSPSPCTVAISADAPKCDVRMCQMAARFDMPFVTKKGEGWANLCSYHARESGLMELGSGQGSYLLHPDEIAPDVRVRLEELGFDELFAGFGGQEPAWSRICRGFGFARVSDSTLVKRGDRRTIWIEHGGSGELRVWKYRAGEYHFDERVRSFDRVIPSDWPAEMIREVLFNVLAVDSSDRPGTPEGLGLTLQEAETVVRDGLKSSNQTSKLTEHLLDGQRDRFWLEYDESPFQHASRIAVRNTTDLDLLRDIYAHHQDSGIRCSVIARDDCPVDILWRATREPAGRRALLTRTSIPDEVVAPLFDEIALSSAAAAGRGVMLAAAIHPRVPLGRIEGLAEKALFERDDRLALLDGAARLDSERREALWTLVLRTTHRGKRQDEVMGQILGGPGLTETEAIEWLHGLPDGPTKLRALKWVRTRRARGSR